MTNIPQIGEEAELSPQNACRCCVTAPRAWQALQRVHVDRCTHDDGALELQNFNLSYASAFRRDGQIVAGLE